MKKICIITPNEFPVPAIKGGAVEGLVNNLIDLNEKKHKLDITCVSIMDSEAKDKARKYNNTKFIFVDKYFRGFIKVKREKTFFDKVLNKLNLQYYFFVKSVYNKIKKMKFDFIIIEGGDLEAYDYLIKRKRDSKYIGHIHGAEMMVTSKSSLYDSFISVSDFAAKAYTKSGYIKIKDIDVLHNGINNAKFGTKIDESEKNKIRTKLKISKKDFVIVYCGRLVKEKGVKELLLAFKKVRQDKKIKLLIIGSSNFNLSYKNSYEEELKNITINMSQDVVFTGYVPNTEIYKYYNIADVFVAPSLCEDAFPLSVLEAMASGLPIISTYSGGIVEQVTSKNAILLERNDNLVDNISSAIDSLYNDKEKKASMSNESVKQSKKFTLEKYYDGFVEILKKRSNNND